MTIDGAKSFLNKGTANELPTIPLRVLRASVCTAVGAGLVALGLRRKGAVGGLLTMAGGVSLFHALTDLFEQRRHPVDLPGSYAPPNLAFESHQGQSSSSLGFPESGAQPAVWSSSASSNMLDQSAMEEGLPETTTYEKRDAEHRVIQGSEESFPASDAPSWTPGRT